jgi:hypothetical protein
MAHPTEAELRNLGNEILDLLVEKTIEEADSWVRAQENMSREDPNFSPSLMGPRTLMEEVEAYVRDTYGFLPDTFANFAEPRPDEFEDAVNQSVQAAMILQPGLQSLDHAGPGAPARQSGDVWPNPSFATEAAASYPTTASERISAVTSQIDDWSGDAADAFHLHYMNEFPDALKNQHMGVAVLAITMEANKRIFERVGHDILDIGEKTKEALRHVTDKDPTGAMVTFTVVAAVASVVSAGVATPAMAVAWASASALAGGAATFFSMQEEPQEREIEGATTQEIMASMMERITELYNFIRAEEQKIVGCLEAVQDFFSNPNVRQEIEMPLPDSYENLDASSYNQIQDDFMYPG